MGPNTSTKARLKLGLLAVAGACIAALIYFWSTLPFSHGAIFLLVVVAFLGSVLVAWKFRAGPNPKADTGFRQRMREQFEPVIQRQQRRKRMDRDDPDTDGRRFVHDFGASFVVGEDGPLADPEPLEPSHGSLEWALWVLDIPKADVMAGNVSEDDIHRKWRKASKAWHPDRFRNSDSDQQEEAAERMADLNLAKTLVHSAIYRTD